MGYWRLTPEGPSCGIIRYLENIIHVVHVVRVVFINCSLKCEDSIYENFCFILQAYPI